MRRRASTKAKQEKKKTIEKISTKKPSVFEKTQPIVEEIIDVEETDIDSKDDLNNFEDLEVDFNLGSDIDLNEDLGIISLSEVLGETLPTTQPSKEELDLIESEQKAEKQERVIQATGQVKHYPIEPPEDKKQRIENTRNRIFSYLMTKRGMSYVDSRGMLETLLMTKSLEQIEQDLIVVEVNQKKQQEIIEQRKSEGVQSMQFKSKTNYY